MTRTALFISTAALALSAASSALAAADIGENVVGEVVITANRSAQAADRIGQTVTVLNRETIEASQAVVLTDLLSQTPGVSFSRNGGVGALTSLRIRGAETDHTLLVIDGVKLNDPSQSGGGYNFANLLTGDADRIEVLRGAQSTLWGSQAIGGVVQIITREPTEPLEASASLEGGSMHAGYARAGLGGAGERLTWRVAASRYRTDGVSAYAPGTEKDGYRNTGASARLNYKLTDALSLDLRGLYSAGRNEFDGFGVDDLEFGRTEDTVLYAGLNLDLFGGRLHNRLGYDFTRTDRENLNPEQAVTTLTYDALGENRRVEYQGVWDIREGWTATFGAESEDSRMRSSSPSAFDPAPVPARAKTGIDSLYAQVQGEVVQGLTLTAGVRRDDHETFGGHTLGQLAAAWSLNEGRTVLRASWGQGFKAPTLYQLYSDYGNVTLDPEEAESWDAGVEQAFFGDRLRLSATYFHRLTTNQIDFVSCPFPPVTDPQDPDFDPKCPVDKYGYYANVARTKGQGVELTGAARLGRLSLQGNYTWTEAKNDAADSASYGRFLTRRPEHQANLWATYVWPAKLSTTVAVRYVGEAYDNAANSFVLKAYTLVDLRAAYPLNDRVEVYGRIENLTDESYQTARNYNSTGRAAYVGVRANF